jgi:hypothetical protein
MFCVLDNNIRNFKCMLSGAGFSAQEMAKSLGWSFHGIRPDNPVRGRIIRPPRDFVKIAMDQLGVNQIWGQIFRPGGRKMAPF